MQLGVAEQELHIALFQLHILKPFLRPEMPFPHGASRDVVELGLDHSAQFRGPTLGFRFQNPVDLTFEAENHSALQFRRDNHDLPPGLRCRRTYKSGPHRNK